MNRAKHQPITLITVLSLIFITLLFSLWTLSAQAGSMSKVRLPLQEALAAEQANAPWGIPSMFTPTWATKVITPIVAIQGLRESSLKLDGNGYPHIVYGDNNKLYYAWFDGGTWQIQMVHALGGGITSPSLALDSNGYPHIGYKGELTAWYAQWDGNDWVFRVVEGGGNNGHGISIALDNNDLPHFSYHYGPDKNFHYATWNGSTWALQVVDAIEYVGIHSSMALDSGDTPYMAYYAHGSQDLKYAGWTGASWALQTIDSTDNVGANSTLVLDSGDNPHISYYDATNQDLKYTRWNSPTWDIQTVDSTDDVGATSSLALDSNDNPHISYFDVTNGILKYAVWNGSSWDLQSAANVGVGNAGGVSLVLDSNDTPHVAYYDAINQTLNYAWGEVTAVITSTGGTLIAPNLGMITFPANTFTEPVIVRYTPLEDVPATPHVGIFFDLSAVYADSGQSATLEPGQSFTITLKYDTQATCINEDSLITVFWRLKRQQQQSGSLDLPPGWEAETTVVDAEAKTVTAVVDELGVYSVFGACNLFLPFVIQSNS